MFQRNLSMDFTYFKYLSRALNISRIPALKLPYIIYLKIPNSHLIFLLWLFPLLLYTPDQMILMPFTGKENKMHPSVSQSYRWPYVSIQPWHSSILQIRRLRPQEAGGRQMLASELMKLLLVPLPAFCKGSTGCSVADHAGMLFHLCRHPDGHYFPSTEQKAQVQREMGLEQGQATNEEKQTSGLSNSHFCVLSRRKVGWNKKESWQRWLYAHVYGSSVLHWDSFKFWNPCRS